MIEFEDDEAAIMAKLVEVVDRSIHCRQVQIKSFNVVMSHAYRLVQMTENQVVKGKKQKRGKSAKPAAARPRGGSFVSNLMANFYPAQKTDEEDEHDAALLTVLAIFEDYIDDHKENAFRSAFQEPNRCYFTIQHGRDWRADNVDTHANNFMIALVNACLGVQVPLLPALWDNWPNANVDFWQGLSEEVWERAFSPKAKTFGMAWQGIPYLKDRDKRKHIRASPQHAHFPHNQRIHGTAKRFANSAVSGTCSGAHRKVYKKYLERFASFFERDFFCEKSFNKLNSEEKPEHAGFRKACEVLYQSYKREQGNDVCPEETFVDHCFEDSDTMMYSKLSITNIDRFYVYLGIIRPGPTTKLKPAGMVKTYAAKKEEVVANTEPVDEMAKSAGGKNDVSFEQRERSSCNRTSPYTHLTHAGQTTHQMEELAVKLADVSTALQDAMRSRDGKAIRRLMAERNRLNAQQRSLKEKLDDEAADLSASEAKMIRNESEDDKCDPRARIQKQLQEAMRKRDTKAIRKLMKERAQLNKIEATDEDKAKEAQAKAIEKAAAEKAAEGKVPAMYTLHRVKSFESVSSGSSAGNEDDNFVFPKEGADFVEEFCNIFALSQGRDAQFRAAIYERWQMFELCNEGDLRVVRRAA